MMKTTTTTNPIEMIKEELCSRYGIQPEQIQLELTVKGVEKEKGMEILKDYAKHPFGPYYTDEHKSGHTSANGFYWVHVREPKENEVTEYEFIIE
jgi:hypothetical protein